MPLRSKHCSVLAAGMLLVGAQSLAQESGFKLVPSGAMAKIGFYRPQRLKISPAKPASVIKEPTGLISPQYGSIEFGPKESKKSYGVILDEPDGKPAQLFVDANGDGDFTNDPPVKWTGSEYKGGMAKRTISTQVHGLCRLNFMAQPIW